MKKAIIFIISLITSVQSFSQIRYSKKITTFGLPIKDNLMYYTIYPSDFTVGIECDSYENCENKFPEQTLMSIISANNFEWDKKNYNYEIQNNEKKYKSIKKLDKNKYYFQLLRKITFENNGQKYAIIKYHIREDKKLVPMCNILINESEKWFVLNSEGSLSKAYIMFTYLSTNALDAIFKNGKLNIASFDEQTRNFFSNGILDFSKTINSKSNSKMEEKELKIVLDELFFNQSIGRDSDRIIKKNEKLDLKKITNSPIPANYVKELNYQVLYTYEKKDYPDLEKDSEIIGLINQTGYNQNEINPIFRFTFRSNNHFYTVLKFSKTVDENMFITKLFLKENDTWEIVDKSSAEPESFYKVLSSIKINFLETITNIGGNSNFPEINKLKPIFKDENGILDIYKLADVIEKNKTLLSKYLDE